MIWVNKRSKIKRTGSQLCGHLVSLPRLWLGHITEDKREIKDFPKLPSVTSFIHDTLSLIKKKQIIG